jgi:hypothetical protein
MDYKNKYLKYKEKYLNLKNQIDIDPSISSDNGNTGSEKKFITLKIKRLNSSRNITYDISNIHATVSDLKKHIIKEILGSNDFELNNYSFVLIKNGESNKINLNDNNATLQSIGINDNSTINFIPNFLVFNSEHQLSRYDLFNVLVLCTTNNSILSNKYLDIIKNIPGSEIKQIDNIVFIHPTDDINSIPHKEIENKIKSEQAIKIMSHHIFTGDTNSYIKQSEIGLFDIIIDEYCPGGCSDIMRPSIFYLLEHCLKQNGKFITPEPLNFKDLNSQLTNNCFKTSPLLELKELFTTEHTGRVTQKLSLEVYIKK